MAEFWDENESYEEYSCKLGQIVDNFKLEVLYEPENCRKSKIYSADVNRPGLPLSGFFDCFDKKRIQLIGHAEHRFLSQLNSEARLYKLEQFAALKPPMIVITSSLSAFDEIINACKEYSIPLYRTAETTSNFQASLIGYLSVELAPRITRHGVLVEVYGEGVLILGDSGVGKSETAIELVKRGHRLIADDAVEIKRVSEKTLVGSAPPIIKHFVELRGIGIVDVRRIFGMGAVKETEKIDLVIRLEQWDKNKTYDRMGLETETTKILGLDITTTTIPVRPGRNLAIILEIAAMNNRQKKMGYNTAEEFNKRIQESLLKGRLLRLKEIFKVQ
ncbi:MAG: HPr(Ser) kinase/phosphatase, partial [Clostridia bacterium]|nr:HPr(Ser) kinase/phosphatase [Clostridia bacterium]